VIIQGIETRKPLEETEESALGASPEGTGFSDVGKVGEVEEGVVNFKIIAWVEG